MTPNMTNVEPDLTCNPKLGGRLNFEIRFLGKVGYHSNRLNEGNTIISNALL